MTDITEALRQFGRRRDGWREERSIELATALAQRVGGYFDWDPEAGEEWARVLLAGRELAYVSSLGPLVLVEGLAARGIETAFPDFQVLLVGSLAETTLTADKQVLHEVFGARADNEVFADETFSAQDLWFATV